MYRVVLISFLIFATANTLVAQHHDGNSSTPSGPVDLGKIDFPTSGPAEAQSRFIEGVLLLHSFEYARARRAFEEASKLAPDFAMAYWGEAMTYDHPIWGEYDKMNAIAALNRLAPTAEARRAKAPTAREKMYLDAVEKLFTDANHAATYSSAMAEITKRFPDDLEAQAFYALSILGLTGTTRNRENYMHAAKVAEAVYQKNPLHPGALHYLIHSYDDPDHASQGLRAARAYGTVARSASHAQHMPSHIFFALGLWEDSIEANKASLKTARDEGNPGYHPLHWLIHAYLQIGRDDEALKLLALIEDDAKAKSFPSTKAALAMSRATILVETQGKAPPSAMEPVDVTGGRSISAIMNHYLAIGLEQVRRNQLSEAKNSLTSIHTRNAGAATSVASSGVASPYSTAARSDISEGIVVEQILEAAIQFAAAQRDEALRKAVAAAEAEDKLIFEYGPPAIVKPAWEQAGEMFLAAGKKSEAANAFRNALKRYPNRKLSNEGLKAATQ